MMMIQVRRPGCVRKNVPGMKQNMVPGKADGEIQTAGSDKHNEPQEYCAYGCVAHARRVGGSVGKMGSAIVCCVPGVKKTDDTLPIRTYEIWSYPLPPKKKTFSA